MDGEKKAAMLRPVLVTAAYRRLRVTLLGRHQGINQLIPWQVLQCILTGHVWPVSGFTPGTLPPLSHTHYHTHTLAAAPIRQHQVLFLPPQNPGCPSHQESEGSLNPEQVNEVEERKSEQQRPSPTSLLPVLFVAR